MKQSTLGAIMQKTFAKSITGSSIVLDSDGDIWMDEGSAIPPRYVSSPENGRIVIMDWKNSRS